MHLKGFLVEVENLENADGYKKINKTTGGCMIQAQLNLPRFTNKGKSTRKTLNQLEVETCKKFGGLTTYTGKGKWLNNNKLYYDNLNIYQIYIKRNQTKLFIKHAIKYGKLTKQLAVAIVINNKPRILEI